MVSASSSTTTILSRTKSELSTNRIFDVNNYVDKMKIISI